MNRFIVQQAPWDPPELPSPYCGSYELWVSLLNQEEGLCVLNLWCDVGGRIVAPYVRSFHGETPDDCLEQFGAWLSGLACDRACQHN